LYEIGGSAMIKPLIDRLSIICAEFSDDQIRDCIKNIFENESDGRISPKGSFLEIVKYLKSRGVPEDFKMIERAVLLEGSRRFHNVYNSKQNIE
jgi:hypothetical protein